MFNSLINSIEKNCAVALEGGVGWPRPGSGRGEPPLVDEYRACSADSIFHRRCHTEKPDRQVCLRVFRFLRPDVVVRLQCFCRTSSFACIAVFVFAPFVAPRAAHLWHSWRSFRVLIAQSTVYIAKGVRLSV